MMDLHKFPAEKLGAFALQQNWVIIIYAFCHVFHSFHCEILPLILEINRTSHRDGRASQIANKNLDIYLLTECFKMPTADL